MAGVQEPLLQLSCVDASLALKPVTDRWDTQGVVQGLPLGGEASFLRPYLDAYLRAVLDTYLQLPVPYPRRLRSSQIQVRDHHLRDSVSHRTLPQGNRYNPFVLPSTDYCKPPIAILLKS